MIHYTTLLISRNIKLRSKKSFANSKLKMMSNETAIGQSRYYPSAWLDSLTKIHKIRTRHLGQVSLLQRYHYINLQGLSLCEQNGLHFAEVKKARAWSRSLSST